MTLDPYFPFRLVEKDGSKEVLGTNSAKSLGSDLTAEVEDH